MLLCNVCVVMTILKVWSVVTCCDRIYGFVPLWFFSTLIQQSLKHILYYTYFRIDIVGRIYVVEVLAKLVYNKKLMIMQFFRN
jgi:hypothetical protein